MLAITLTISAIAIIMIFTLLVLATGPSEQGSRTPGPITRIEDALARRRRARR